MHMKFSLISIFLLFFTISFAQPNAKSIAAAKAVISRTVGNKMVNRVQFSIMQTNDATPVYEYKVTNNKLSVSGNSTVALCRGFYDYLKTSGQGMVNWSGSNLNIQPNWKNIEKTRVQSPYQYHYYMNVVTHGYSTPYWDWQRWEKELDWMALHGMDMPLINNAYEAIMFRVYKKMGLSNDAIKNFFVGPAFQPWNRMGNITGWNGPAPASWYDKQIVLTHKVLDRMKDLQMTPIIQSFAGFVPKEITTVYPESKITPLVWNGSFSENNKCNLLLPDGNNKDLFIKIGKLFVEEWEKEFGKGKYFLADSFNEMKVPRTEGETEEEFQQQLSEYGDVVYQSIKQANKDGIWVMQGWTFGYQRDDWSPQRLQSLVSKAPDNKVLFLDLANDYNLDFWHISTSWEFYKGFFNKQWLYSFIPNMGGKTAWNGILKTYAEAPITALQYADKGKLIGYGFAPEGIENNELIYEMLSDMGWRDTKIDLDDWLKSYCIQRYGSYPEKMKEAYQYFLKSCYGTFTDHPRFAYQSGDNKLTKGTVNKSPEFFKGVKLFLSCVKELDKSVLYKNDAIELTAQYLSLTADSLVNQARKLSGEQRTKTLNEAYSILENTDRLLLSHPNHRLQRWVNFAGNYGDNAQQKQYYEQDARRIITTWGPGVNDYAARMWSGLIGSYYLPRLKMVMDGKSQKEIESWQEQWIKKGDINKQQPFVNPVQEAQQMIKALEIKNIK